ncbi:MAG TPA: acetyl-CoA hydrolase/transferase C-terminal domain-containing protein [Anaerolineales bacterium]|nr:acetyl-CoA hydrolase/transferase C-terminal domain-containing protein [Anaerolineales bacterium]
MYNTTLPRISWTDLCNKDLTSAAEAVKEVQSGMRVFLTGNCSVPQVALAALVARAPALENVEIIQVLSIGAADYVSEEMAGHLRLNTLFISDNVREAVNQGRADFTPLHLAEIPRLFSTGVMPIDIAMIQVSPPDQHGFCSFGVEVGVSKTAAQFAKIVIAEINPQMPRTLGDSFLHISKIDHMIPVDYPLPEVSMGEPTELSKKIGRQVAGLIDDGSTLQMGIGSIPNGVLHHLWDKRDLGIHTELFSDGVIDLYEAGVITNAKKTLHPGKMIAGFLLGTRRLYDFVDNNPVVELHPTEYVNDSYIIAQNDKMVAINSAIEIDLTGQICADSIGTRLYSGTGGQLDFIRGAARSKGGKPIIALPSVTVTGAGQRFSRIVPTLKPGAGVVTTRNDVHYVVTEYGVADLYGKSIRQRARALVEIAHPELREELEDQASKLKYI